MRSLTDFLNHGILPFVGRRGSIDEIVSFWRDAIRRGSLETMLVEAPAGRGKSRLAEELPESIRPLGGILLRVRLYPDTPTALEQDLSRRLALVEQRFETDAQQTHDPIDRLRRLARLRPTLLLLEDLHLLDPDGFGRLQRLLGELSDEPLGLLVLTRPLSPELRGLLEPSLVRSTELPPFGEEEIGLVWQDLFESTPPTGVIESLRRTTRGNPLALRSGLRGAVEQKAIVDFGSGWGIDGSIERFEDLLSKNVGRLVEGMMLHLTAEERRAASLLARLGEIFSREGAEALLDGERDRLEDLIFKGIIVVAGSEPTSLNQKASRSLPLRFSHTLLHEYCAAEPIEAVDIDRLVAPLVAGAPHYSYVLFPSLLTVADDLTLETGSTAQLIVALRDIFNGASHHPGHRNLETVHRLFERIVDRACDEGIWTGEESLFHRGLVQIMWGIGRISNWRSEESRRRTRQLEELTRNPGSYRIARMRLRAMADMIDTTQAEHDDEGTRTIVDDVPALLADFPDLEVDPQYFYYLGRILHRAPHLSDLCTHVIAEYERLSLRRDEMAPAARIRLRRLAPFMLDYFRTSAEFSARLRLLDELEADPEIPDHFLTVFRELLLLNGGKFTRLASVIDVSRKAVTLYNDESGQRTLTMLSRNLDRFLEIETTDLEELLDALASETDEQARNHAIWHLLDVESLALGFDNIFSRLDLADDEEVRRHTPGTRLRMGLRNPKYLASLDNDTLTPLREKLLGRKTSVEEIREGVDDYLEREPVMLPDLSGVLGIVEFLDRLSPSDRTEIARDRKAAEALIRWIDHLCEAPAPGIVVRLLEDFGALLSKTERQKSERRLKDARSKAAEIAGIRSSSSKGTSATDREETIRLNMIGEIELRLPEEPEMRPVRGAGIKRALGTLVADRMLPEPMPFDEIARLFAADEAVDPERGRKTVNDLAYKLRKLLGPDAIKADRGSIALDTDLVDVDLVRLIALLREAEAGIEEGTAARTLGGLTEALDLFAKGPAWPGLYDSFFEAARSELEWRLRKALLRTAAMTAEAGDVEAATDLLRRGAEAMAGDEEITEELAELLRKQGKFIEAERVSSL